VEKPKGLYYQITYVAFPKDTEVRSFQLPLDKAAQAALDRVQAAWKEPGARAVEAEYGGEHEVRPGETVEIAARKGPSVIRAFRLKIDGAPPDGLRKLVLRGYFDDHPNPDIEAPVADFFGNAYGGKE